jgi:hypothetical protein
MIDWRQTTEPSLSGDQVKHAVVGEFRLVAIDLQADQLGPAEIVWELYGPPDHQTLLETGTADSLDAAKAAAEQAFAARQKSN